MDPYKVIKELILNSHHLPTGNTIHISEGREIPTPYKLQIAQYSDGNGFYLFYLNKENEVLTDTYHDSIIQAEEQAEFEFNVNGSDWVRKSK
jgi:hypothetical protein